MINNYARRRFVPLLVLAGVFTCMSANPDEASAEPIVGYSLQITEGIVTGGSNTLMSSAQLLAARDAPLFTLANTSTSALITMFSITIGDLNYNFDAVTFNPVPVGPQVTSYSPDNKQGGARSDELSLNFANFQAGQAFAFRGDIDPDNGNALANFRTVLSGNNPAFVTVAFSDGSVLQQYLSPLSATSGGLYSIYRCAALVSSPPISQQGMSNAIPEPSALTLAGVGAVGMLLAGVWRRRTAARGFAVAR
jgi:hypothetical protein